MRVGGIYGVAQAIVSDLGTAKLFPLPAKRRPNLVRKVHSAKHIFRAGDGFISLRKLGHTYCSKLLIRQAIEVMFRLESVRREGRCSRELQLGRI
jgi:hypothetical protein